MENGLVKGYTTLDRQGVNFGNSLPRESAFYRNQIAHVSEFQPIEADPKSINLPKRFIFVPFQVNGDSQVICYSHWVKNMSHMADILIECAPELKEKDVSIVVKPHPNCSTPNDELLNHLLSNNITVVKDIDSKALVSLAEAVVTINSTVGLEALEAGKKVIVLGQAFYNIPDMVLSANSLSELKACFKKLSGWEPDARAVQGLFHYLRNTYQIKGNWREADQEHLNMCLEKLDEMDAE
jgi:capsular polysaccharide export protein